MSTDTRDSAFLSGLTGVVVFLTVVLLLSAAFAHAEQPNHRLAVSVGESSVEVRRATPGGTVLLIGYELTWRDYSTVYRQVRYEQPAGPDGSLTLAMDRSIVEGSFWVAFDLTSGAHGGSTRAGQRLREAEIPERALRKSVEGSLEKIEVRLEYVYAVAIRPGVGVWELATGDGGESDDDGGLDGKIALVPRRLKKTAHTTADLVEFREGDLIAVFAPHQMGYLIKEVKK